MFTTFVLVASLLNAGDDAAFAERAELQGLYDELTQATLAFQTIDELDDFHAVLYTPDWTFIDINLQPHTWTEMREQALAALDAPPPDSITESIRTMSTDPAGVVAVVEVKTVRTTTGVDGRTHPESVSETFRDVWVKAGTSFKLKSRQQMTLPVVVKNS